MQGEKHVNEECCIGKISEGVLANGGVSIPAIKVKSWEGWIGHSLNPIGCLFETLVDANRHFMERGKRHTGGCRSSNRKHDIGKKGFDYLEYAFTL